MGGGFGFRFNLSLKARCALRLGEGPRAFGFSMLIFSRCRGVCAKRGLSTSTLGTSAATTILQPLARSLPTAKFLQMFSETIELRGHIIDSLILPKVLD